MNLLNLIFGHPLLTIVVLALAFSLPYALTPGRRTEAMLSAMQARFGGAILRRRFSPSELRITTEGRLVIFGASLGSSSNGPRSSPSVFARIYLLDWAGPVPTFSLKGRGHPLTAGLNRLFGADKRPEMELRDEVLDQKFRLVAEDESPISPLIKFKEELLQLRKIATPHEIMLRLSREVPPQPKTWKWGDPIIQSISREELEAQKTACLTLHLLGRSIRSEAESAAILSALMSFSALLIESRKGASPTPQPCPAASSSCAQTRL